MPSAVAYAGAYLMMSGAATAVGAFLLSYATVIGYGLLLVGAYATIEKSKREAKDKYNASQVDRLQSIVTTTGSRELVLGRVRKGGVIAFRDSCGSYNATFVMVVALASHKIDGVEKYYLNGDEVTVDSDGDVLTEPYGRVTRESKSLSYAAVYVWETASDGEAIRVLAPCTTAYYPTPTGITGLVSGSMVGPYYVTTLAGKNDQTIVYTAQYSWQTDTESSVANIRIYDGSQTTADARLQALFPGVWTSSHILYEVAYAIIELTFNESAFPSGVPTFTALIRGAQVYDPRTGTTAWSQNPALHARHIIMHSRFGKRSSLTANEEARIVAAANACDTSYTPSDGTATQLYKSSVVFPYGGTASDALDDLCQGMCGMWAYAGGEFFIKAGVYTAPVKTLVAADLATKQKDSTGGSTSKAITISTHKARADKVNSITAKIYDADSEYVETTITAVSNTEAIASDGMTLPLELTLPVVSTAAQAQVICNYTLKDSYDPLSLVANFKLSAYEIELFDNIALTIPRFGWTEKVFTVLGRTFNPTGLIELTLRETSAEVFNPEVYSDSGGYASNTGLQNPWDITDPGILTISSGTSELLLQGDGSLITRVRVQWTEVTDERIRQGGYVEVRWRSTSKDTWTTISVPGVESSAYILGAVDGDTVIVMARTRTQLAVSEWNVQQTHVVLGKSEPPSNVTGLYIEDTLLSWTTVSDIDLAGYEIRYHYGTANTDWGTAINEHTGLVTSIPYTLRSKPTTVVTFMVKAVDRSGNYSLLPAYLTANLGDTIVANVVESYDYTALGYPGAIIGGAIEGTEIKADLSDAFYGEDVSEFYQLEGQTFYTTNSDAMSWTSTVLTPTKAATGSNMLIDFTEVSSGYAVEYRLTGPNPFYGLDLTYFYGEDASLFYDSPPDFSAWPGSVTAINDEYQFRYRAIAGSTQAVLSEFTVYIDVPDKLVYFADLAISAGGTRLPVAGQFSVIQNIQLTLQDTSAISAYVADKDVTLGPLVYTTNALGVAIASVVDVTIQGY